MSFAKLEQPILIIDYGEPLGLKEKLIGLVTWDIDGEVGSVQTTEGFSFFRQIEEDDQIGIFKNSHGNLKAWLKTE